MKPWPIILPIIVLLFLSGCSSVITERSAAPVAMKASWAILPFLNNTETPYAAAREEAITRALLFAHGLQGLVASPEQEEGGALPVDRGSVRYKAALAWARRQGVRYVISGAVNEWRYKVGLDGEPVVGITMEIRELPAGRVVWSGSGAKSGWSREAVSAVAQQVTKKLLAGITFK